jgi:hypothetical protein
MLLYVWPNSCNLREFFTSVTFLHNFQQNVICNKSVITTVNSILIIVSPVFG